MGVAIDIDSRMPPDDGRNAWVVETLKRTLRCHSGVVTRRWRLGSVNSCRKPFPKYPGIRKGCGDLQSRSSPDRGDPLHGDPRSW